MTSFQIILLLFALLSGLLSVYFNAQALRLVRLQEKEEIRSLREKANGLAWDKSIPALLLQIAALMLIGLVGLGLPTGIRIYLLPPLLGLWFACLLYRKGLLEERLLEEVMTPSPWLRSYFDLRRKYQLFASMALGAAEAFVGVFSF